MYQVSVAHQHLGRRAEYSCVDRTEDDPMNLAQDFGARHLEGRLLFRLDAHRRKRQAGRSDVERIDGGILGPCQDLVGRVAQRNGDVSHGSLDSLVVQQQLRARYDQKVAPLAQEARWSSSAASNSARFDSGSTPEMSPPFPL